MIEPKNSHFGASVHAMFTFGKPSQYVSDRIELYWTLHAGKGGTFFHEVYPDPQMNLVFRYSKSSSRMVLMGPRLHKAFVEMDADSEYLCLRFRTCQAPRLVDVQAADLLGRYVQIDHLGDIPAERLAESFLNTPALSTRRRLLEKLVCGYEPLVEDPAVRDAARSMETHEGICSIKALCKDLGFSPRTLERRFMRHMGLSPKQTARLIRFWSLLKRMDQGRGDDLAALAQSFGYSDQTHMTKEFRAFSDRTPGSPEAWKARPLTAKPSKGVIHRRQGVEPIR